MRFQTSRPVRVEFTKWDGRPHWEYDGIYLGADEHGDWIGHPAGTLMSRPGRRFVDTAAWLTLVPAAGRPWLVTYNDPAHHLRIYVDLTTPAEWDGTVLRAIDLDLDVVVPRDGREPFIDDEDEFAEHRELFGYPEDVAGTAETSAQELLAAVNDGKPPFDQTADRWLESLAAIAG